MPTYAALTTLPGREPADALAEALEDLEPEPYGVGAFEIEDGSGLWEVGAYFFDPPDEVALALLAAVHAAKDSPSPNCPRSTGSPRFGANCIRWRPGGSSSMALSLIHI